MGMGGRESRRVAATKIRNQANGEVVAPFSCPFGVGVFVLCMEFVCVLCMDYMYVYVCL